MTHPIRNIINQIGLSLAETIQKETGATVEVTNRGVGLWTISGPPDDARTAAKYLTGHALMEPDGMPAHYADADELYIYLADAN